MTSCTQKSCSIDRAILQQQQDLFENEHQTQNMQSYLSERNKRQTFLKEQYLSINEEELQNKVNEFLTFKLSNEKQTVDQYHDQYCVCTDCAYERNLAKPSHTLFNLTMRSNYKKDFKDNSQSYRRTSVTKFDKDLKESFNAKNINQKQTSIYPKQKVSFQTVYNVSMKKEASIERTQTIRNEDSLKFDGPFSNTTTYRSKFPGITGGNPYVKPVDKAVRDKFQLSTKTMNSDFYKGLKTDRPSLARSPDNLRIGLPMLWKQSTSHNFYKAPTPLNPEQIKRSFKAVPKRVESPNFEHQYESTYEKEFQGSEVLEMAKHKKRLIRETMSKLGMGY